MGNKEEKWTQCVTLTVLLMMVMTVEGTDPVCRPFCHLPPETHEKCSSLRFLFSCISKVKMRYNSEKSFIKLHLFYKSGFFLKKKFKTKLNCGNAVTNVKHLTHVNYIPQIYVFKTVLVYHFVHLQDVQWTFTVPVNGCTHWKMSIWSRRDWQKSGIPTFLSSVPALLQKIVVSLSGISIQFYNWYTNFKLWKKRYIINLYMYTSSTATHSTNPV